MNKVMYEEAMRRIEEITTAELTDALAASGFTGSEKLSTRYLTFSREGIPSKLFNEVDQILTEQLGNKWIMFDKRWVKGGAPKTSFVYYEIAVEDEAAEVLIRLVLPTTIKLESSIRPYHESRPTSKEPDHTEEED